MATKAIENTTNASFERASASLGNAITNHIQNNKAIILAFLVLQYTKKRKQYTSCRPIIGIQLSVVNFLFDFHNGKLITQKDISGN